MKACVYGRLQKRRQKALLSASHATTCLFSRSRAVMLQIRWYACARWAARPDGGTLRVEGRSPRAGAITKVRG